MTIGTKESEFTIFEDGDYEVKFDNWFPLDEQGVPNLVLQDRFGEETLIIRFRTSVNGDDGPPGTIDPKHELLPLVRAFGGDPSKLVDEKDIGRKLLKAQKLMTGSTKLTVANGWIRLNTIQGMGVPEASYYLRFSRITSKMDTGELGYMEGKYGPLVIGKMKISRGEYKDTEVTFFMGYPLVIENGIPALPLKSDGTLTAGSQRFKNYLLGFYGPDYVDFPHQDCEDIDNIMPLLTKTVSERKLEALGFVRDGRVDLNSFGPIPSGELQQEEISFFSKAQETLRNVIATEVKAHKDAGAWLNDDDWALTAEGKEWVGEHLVGIVEEHGLPRIFDEWDAEGIENILKSLGYTKSGKKAEAQF